jgi:hypothetical protein
MSWRKLLLSTLLLFVPFAAPMSASASVATINGCYDCLAFDTPGLQFNVPVGISLTGAQMVITGYNGINTGLTATVNLGTIGSGLTNALWGSLPGVSGSTTPGNMTAGDYDDQYIGTSHILPNSGATANCGGTCVSGGGPQWYADVGSFTITFTATISGGVNDGKAVFSVFSDAVNATGGFVPWEGLDQNGFSEQTCCDIHSGGLTNDLANIDLGVPPSVPIPAALPLFATGLGGLGLLGWRRKRKAQAVA